MAVIRIIEKTDLENLGLSSHVEEMITEGVNFERMAIQDLSKLVDNLVQIISQVMIETQNSRTYNYSYKKIRKNTFKQAILVGGMLVFKLRQFLLQETIYYSLGATDERGQLFQRVLSQDELWSQLMNKNSNVLRSSLSQKAILLSKSLEKFNEEDFEAVGNLNLWPQILNLAFGGPATKEPGEPVMDKYYQKDSNDFNVYVRYTQGRKKAKRNYYYKKGNEFLFYNQGWLYEWYLTYLNKSEEHEQKLLQSIQNNSIAPIIYGMDSVAGVTAGDFIDIHDRYVQAKYHNQKIISFNNIFTLLKQIQTEINILQKKPEEISSVSKKFAEMFTTDEASLQHLNTTYTEILEHSLLSLLKIN